MPDMKDILENLYQRIDEEHRRLLMNQLDHPDPSTRSKVLNALCQHLSDAMLWELAEDPSHIVRKRVVTCATRRGLQRLLEKLAEDPHPSVRAQVARKATEPELILDLSEDRSPRVRRAALLNAVSLDLELGDRIATSLSSDPSEVVRPLAREILKALSGAEFDPQIIPTGVIRSISLGKGGTSHQLSELCDKLKAVSRCEELESILSNLRPETLVSQEIDELSKVFLRMFTICRETIAGIEWLDALLKRAEGDAQKRLLKILDRIDADGSVFHPYLSSLDDEVRSVALDALGKRGNEDAVSLAREIVEKARDSDKMLRASLRTLKRLGLIDASLADSLIRIARNKDLSRSTRKLAMGCLKSARISEMAEEILQLVEDPTEPPSVRKSAARTVAFLNPELLESFS